MSYLPDEYTKVERPLIDQLKGLGWQHIEGDIGLPSNSDLDVLVQFSANRQP